MRKTVFEFFAEALFRVQFAVIGESHEIVESLQIDLPRHTHAACDEIARFAPCIRLNVQAGGFRVGKVRAHPFEDGGFPLIAREALIPRIQFLKQFLLCHEPICGRHFG